MPTQLRFGIDVIDDLSAAWGDVSLPLKTRESFRFANWYYGVDSGKGMTLERIGKSRGVGLTRERVRQIIDFSVRELRSRESSMSLDETKMLIREWVGSTNPGRRSGDLEKIKSSKKPAEKTLHGHGSLLDAMPRPYARAKAWVDGLLEIKNELFVTMDELIAIGYFKAFKNNTKGAISFLNDAGVRQVLYRGCYYLYDESRPRDGVVLAIQEKNRKLRGERTLQKMMGMTKTVTWVPRKVQESIKQTAKSQKIGLNRLYEQILGHFQDVSPYRVTNVRADSGKSTRKKPPAGSVRGSDLPAEKWYFDQILNEMETLGQPADTQLGIYIVKEIAQMTKREAEKNGVSYMHFIRSAFVWFAQRLPREEKVKICMKVKEAREGKV